MTGSAEMTRSPSSRTTSRSVPCVAGCCGPRFRIMSPVSSSTPTCASARWRNARGSMSNSGSGGLVVLMLARSRACLRGGFGVVTLARHRLDVDESGPRLHDTRQQRVVLAAGVALELRREIEVAERGMAVEHEAVHLPA